MCNVILYKTVLFSKPNIVSETIGVQNRLPFFLGISEMGEKHNVNISSTNYCNFNRSFDTALNSIL